MTRCYLFNRVSSSALALTTALLLHGTTVHAAQDTVTQLQYDANGNPTQAIDPRGRATNFSYDPLNRLKEQLLPPALSGDARPAIKLTYDGLDQIADVLDARSLNTNYALDGLGNALSLSSPDTGVTNATYDAAGNLKSRTDARGKTRYYTYDALNRITKIGYSSGTPSTFEYDNAPNAKGRLTKMTYDGGSTAYTYDSLGRITTQVQTLGTALPLTTSYAYGTSGSVLGKLVAMTYPSGNQLIFGYNAMGQVNSISLRPTNADGVGTSPTSIQLLTDITYSSFETVSAWVWGNSTAVSPNVYSRTFDIDGRITTFPLGHAANNGVIRSLSYDAAGRVISASHTGTGTGVFAPARFNQVYSYDDLSRLTGFSIGSSTRSYQYDANGNRTASAIDGDSFTHTIASNSNRLSATEGPQSAYSNTYDAAGNLIDNGTITYSFSDSGRMKTATIGAAVVNYFVNGLGQRVKKAGPWSMVSRGVNQYVYDGEGRLLGEYDGAGKVLQETVYLNNLPVAVLKQTTAVNAVTTNIYYVYSDHLSTPRVITRAADNKMVWRWDAADPFGAALPNENPQALGVFTYNPRFPGQLFDGETGLHYNYFRDYEPSSGRYIESDPLGLSAGMNTFAYVNSNPLGSVDQFGLRPLTEREKRCLAPFIPKVDLDNAEIHDEAPWYLIRSLFSGITRGNDIYFQSGVYDGSTLSGLSLLVHELHHVGQYREGKTWLNFILAGITGHHNSVLEKSAREVESDLRAAYYPNGNADCPCTPGTVQTRIVRPGDEEYEATVARSRRVKGQLEASAAAMSADSSP